MIENWMGQEIDEGSYVYRGAREGNSSSFKVGRVLYITPEKGTARVQWLYYPSAKWVQVGDNKFDHRVPIIAQEYEGCKGSPSIDSLCVISQAQFDEIEHRFNNQVV